MTIQLPAPLGSSASRTSPCLDNGKPLLARLRARQGPTRWMSLALAATVAGCQAGPFQPNVSTGNPVAVEDQQGGSSTGDAPPDLVDAVDAAIATIAEIHQLPVWVQQLQASDEIPAEEKMELLVGETIRTEGDALAQVDLKNGLSFRVGGDSILTLQPDNRLNLDAGEMITWVEPGKKVPTEIVTPTAIAAIRGTTVFVNIPEDPNAETEFFAWEGTVAVRLPDEPGEILLEAGEQLKIGPGKQNLEQLRQRVEKLSPREHRRRRQQSRLINSFQRPLETLKQIDEVLSAVPIEIAQGAGDPTWVPRFTEPRWTGPASGSSAPDPVAAITRQAAAVVERIDPVETAKAAVKTRVGKPRGPQLVPNIPPSDGPKLDPVCSQEFNWHDPSPCDVAALRLGDAPLPTPELLPMPADLPGLEAPVVSLRETHVHPPIPVEQPPDPLAPDAPAVPVETATPLGEPTPELFAPESSEPEPPVITSPTGSPAGGPISGSADESNDGSVNEPTDSEPVQPGLLMPAPSP